MKIPSIMRIAKHKRFHFEPRYYDPVKEDIENRTALIAQELKEEEQAKKNTDSVRTEVFRTKLQSSFNRRDRQEKRSFMIQALIAAILFSLVFFFLNL